MQEAPPPGDDEDEGDPRDYVMARLLAARVQAQAAIDAIDDAAAHFVDPDEDKSGKTRTQLLDDADECLGGSARSLQDAMQVMKDMDREDLEAGEPEPEGDD